MGIVAGIDLGTTTTIATIVKDGIPDVLVIPETGKKVLPSVVTFLPDGRIMVGEEAKLQRFYYPKSTVFSIKRVIGKKFSEPSTQVAIAAYPFKVVEGPNDSVQVEISDRKYSPPEISSIILKRLSQIIEDYAKSSLDGVVITVPANFNEIQRRATTMAGKLAGLEVLKIINEPTAAALAYGFGKELNQKIAVYDFGGGTFDVTILESRNNFFEVLASHGDSFLGGDDLDIALTEYMLNDIKRRFGLDLRNDIVAYSKLLFNAEQAKIRLSEDTLVEIDIPELTYHTNGYFNYSIHISRDVFNKIVSPVIDRTFQIAEESIKLANLRKEEIDVVLLVGGSTKVPIVQEKVRDFFGKEPFVGIEPELVVSMGAAIYADSLVSEYSSTTQQPVLLDVTPLALGVGTVGDYIEILVDKNTPLPVERREIFTNAKDGQKSVKIQIFQGDTNRKSKSMLMGELLLTDLKPAKRGELKIEVRFEIDTNGFLHVSAIDKDTGKRQNISLNILGL